LVKKKEEECTMLSSIWKQEVAHIDMEVKALKLEAMASRLEAAALH